MTRTIGIIAGLLAAPALAWGAGDTGEQSSAKGQQQASAQEERSQPTGEKAKAVQQFRAEDGFFTSPNYDVEGRIASVSDDTITIQRENLPEAELSIASNTKVQVNGDPASAQQLREGQQVRASFNLQGGMPVALEVEAQRREAERNTGDRTTATPPSDGGGAQRGEEDRREMGQR